VHTANGTRPLDGADRTMLFDVERYADYATNPQVGFSDATMLAEERRISDALAQRSEHEARQGARVAVTPLLALAVG